MSFIQDWTPVVLKKQTKPTGNTSTKHHNDSSNGIKVKKILDPKDPDAEPEIHPVMISRVLGQQIQQARIAKQMTQKELANAMCLPVSVINNYERGNCVYNFNHISKIKNYLGIAKNKS